MLQSDEYISIVVPFYLRVDYLRQCIKSIHEYGNYPYELILNDDYAREGKSLEFQDDVSTLILNQGLNMGLAESNNRMISMTKSKYILMINQDCILTKPILLQIKEILDKPYVGIVFSFNEYPGDINPENEYFKTEHSKYTLRSGLGHGSVMGFRREFWEEAGRFDTEVHSGVSDSPLEYKMWEHGYFKSVLEDSGVRNLSFEKHDQRDTTMGHEGRDVASPKLFGYERDEYDLMKERKAFCDNNPKHANSFDYWIAYTDKLMPHDRVNEINWEVAKEHGQYKWKDVILSEQRYKWQ